MGWLLPLALFVGYLSTRSAVDYRRHHHWSRASRDGWILIFLGWLPLIAWIVNVIWPQN